MTSRFAIDYIAFPIRHGRTFTYNLDDPVEAEDVLMHLLAARARIVAIRHDGAVVTGLPFDRMLRVAAGRIAAALLQESLTLGASEVRDRFGFAA